MAVDCPICNKPVNSLEINNHIDSGCQNFIYDPAASKQQQSQPPSTPQSQTQTSSQNHPSTNGATSTAQKRSASSFFSAPPSKRIHENGTSASSLGHTNGPSATIGSLTIPRHPTHPPHTSSTASIAIGTKRSFQQGPGAHSSPSPPPQQTTAAKSSTADEPATTEQEGRSKSDHSERHTSAQTDTRQDGRMTKKRQLQRTAPLAERMRPQNLDQVCGQDLVGPNGVLRSLIESNRVPSMILWGASGTGKTTIARCIASMVGARFIELNATSTGVGECKKIFAEAANELSLTGRKTIVFCDEIHRFNKSQQDVFLKPVEAGTVTLVGATTENPSFKVANALLSRCRTFTLASLTTPDVITILHRALELEAPSYPPTDLLDDEMITYLARFSDGDARTALNLLELALSLTTRSDVTKEDIKSSLTKTLVYDRAGDQHYDTISAFHKSVRGNDPNAALYYLARMLQSGEDALFIARRMVVIASEDVGLADNSLLPLATATYTATQQIGMPEARIPLAHCAVALCLAPKSTRAYRGLNNAFSALREPGVASLPVPLHLRNAPTRLMREMGVGAEYKYPPNYRDGKVSQTYLPEGMLDRVFLEERDLGTEVDAALSVAEPGGSS